MLDPLTILFIGVTGAVLGSVVLKPMAERIERIDKMDKYNQELEALGLETMVVNEAVLADHEQAVINLNKKLEQGIHFDSLEDVAMFADGMFHQLAGGKRLEELARAHGLVCPECARVIVTRGQAVHGLEQQLGTQFR